MTVDDGLVDSAASSTVYEGMLLLLRELTSGLTSPSASGGLGDAEVDNDLLVSTCFLVSSFVLISSALCTGAPKPPDPSISLGFAKSFTSSPCLEPCLMLSTMT